MLKKSKFLLIRTAVPVFGVAKVREAIAKAGAGEQGNYTHCSGSYRSIGRFLPMPGAHPTIGKVGKLEEVEEEIIETLCQEDLVKKVIEALKKAHPYEHPAIDIMPRFEVS